MKTCQHSLKNVSDEEKDLYLKGLVLLANSDGKIDKIEKNFILMLKNITGANDVVTFEINQEVDLVFMENFFNYLRSSDLKYFFITDCLCLMNCDGEIHNNEIHLLQTYMQLINIEDNVCKKTIKSAHLFEPSRYDELIEYIKNNDLPLPTEMFEDYRAFFLS